MREIREFDDLAASRGIESDRPTGDHGVRGAPAPDGFDLRPYIVELTLLSADGRSVTVFLKNRNWATRASVPFPLPAHAPIRYDAVRDPASFSQFGDEDLRHVYAIGVTVREGIEGVTVAASRLLRRDRSNLCTLAVKTGVVAIVVILGLIPVVWWTRRTLGRRRA